MMDYRSLEEEKSRCDRLIGLLEQDREELSAHLQGELLEEYRKLVNLEIRKLQDVKKQLSSMTQSLIK